MLQVTAMAYHPRDSYSAHYQPRPSPPSGGSPVPPPTAMPRQYSPQPPRRRRYGGGGVLVAGGSMLALAAFLIHPGAEPGTTPGGDPQVCITQARGPATLSRDQLKKLIDLDMQTPKADVRELLGEPHCGLGVGRTEANVQAERDAYPLEFDPATWLVVQYENEQYVGYDFSFRR